MKTTSSIGRIVKRNGTLVDYDRRRIETAIYKATISQGKPDRRLAAETARKVEEALARTYVPPAAPSVEDVQDIVERILMEAGQTQLAHGYISYRNQRAMLRASRALTFEITDNIPYRKIYEALRWNMDHDCDTVDGLNRIIRSGHFAELVRAGDRRLEDEVDDAANLLAARRDTVRVVIVAGPSSSGKTTITGKISERLARRGVGVKAINIDHYFFDLATHPRDEFGDYDYETPRALDMPLIAGHLARLLAGETVRTPHYDFKSGRRTLDAHPLRLEPGEMLLIDSLHGLNDAMTAGVPDAAKLKLYIETLGQFRAADGVFMRWADTRLLRRMQRDRQFRNSQPMETLTHWHYVRKSELKNIIPFLRHADFIVNTALPYELPVFRARLFRLISRATRAYGDDPRRLDAHIRANRVCDLLKPLRNAPDETCIPTDSLMREFIGGSRYGH